MDTREIEQVVSQILGEGDTADGAFPESGIIDVKGDFTQDDFMLFETNGSDFKMMAVDGGSVTILDGGSFLVAGVRVGQALFDGPVCDREASGDPEMHVFDISLASLRDAYSIFYDKSVGGSPPDTPQGLEEGVGRIRTLMEWKMVERVLDNGLPSGSVLAFDGALWAGIKGIGQMLGRIVKKANEGGIILCGISKRSMLTHKGLPLIPKVQMVGDDFHEKKAWFLPLEIGSGYAEKEFGRVYVAKLHPYSNHAFRIDLALPGGADEAMGKLAALSNDPTYVGYPYPLARVHNDVAFDRSEVEEMRHLLRNRALERGMDQKKWHLTFQEFHEVLDMNR
ncbi:MAG: hypothetical protein AYK23_03785 [Candidatus Proteinoplasmatales archaeon SG8-5]|nr:MAG: hypothetical protein AYK23_03785 [Candidatus Proteinoplasmatales archaeon SG8-5]